MLNPNLSAQQFLLLFTALIALLLGYQLHARLLPWLRALWQRRRHGLRHFQPHPYQTRLASRQATAPTTEHRHD